MIIGAQGYTIRDFAQTEAGIAASLKKLHDIGFTTFQVSAFGPISPCRLSELADENGLQIVITHTNPDRILNDTQAVIEEHRVLGCRNIGIGAMPQRYIGSKEGLLAFLQEFDRPARLMEEQGMKLQYHNHYFEYEKYDGELGIDMMARLTDPARWGFILDVYWTQFSGRCPAKQIELLKGRIDVCHFKDLAMHGREQRMAPVMEGNLAWDEIFAACEKAGVAYAMIEQDDAYGKNPFDELKLSYENLKKAGMRFARTGGGETP